MTNHFERAAEAIRRGRRFVTHDVWHVGRPGEEVPHGLIIKQVRVAILLVQNMIQDALLLRASALTFATMLAIVPFLTITFFFIETFKLDENIYEEVSNRISSAFVKPTDKEGSGDEADVETTAETTDDEESGGETDVETAEPADIKQQLVNLFLRGVAQKKATKDGEVLENPVQMIADYAQEGEKNFNVSFSIILFVVVTVFGLMKNIESSFNTIWGLKRTRSWFRIFSDYLVILLLLPFLVTVALGVTAALESAAIIERLGPFAFVLLGAQYGTVWLSFASLYFLVPNTRVQFRYALLSGVIAGTLWILAAKAYVLFQFGLDRYSILYSTFAQVPVLLMWVYLSWVILLFGAEVTFAYQNEKTFAMERLCKGASFAYREALALRAMLEIGRHFEAGEAGLSVQAAAEQWNVPTRLLNDTLDCLQVAKLVMPCATEPVTYQPARPPEKTMVADVLRAMRDAGQEPSQLREDESCGDLFRQLAALDTDFHNATILELCERVAKSEEKGEADPSDRVCEDDERVPLG